MLSDLTLGKLLQKTRVKKGYSLDFIYSKLKIPVCSLKALEKDDYDFFPAKIYAQGFLKEYLGFLELDKNHEAKKLESKLENTIKKQKKISLEPAGIQRGFFSAIKPVYLKFALIIFIVFSFLTIWVWKNSNYTKWDTGKTEKSQNSYYDHSFISKLKINFISKAWVKIQSDEKTVFEGFVPEGKTQIWQASKNFTIKTDNPNAFDLVLDERKISPEIKKGLITRIPVTFSGSYY